MRVKLFTTSDDSRVVHKKLTNEIEISAHVIRDMDIINPSLLLLYNEDVPFKYNYMFIPLTKRYYYINSATLKQGKGVEVQAHVDVLKSYNDEIDNLSAFVLRQEHTYNPYYPDGLLAISSQTNYLNKSFGKVADDYEFYVTTNGGV